MKIAITASIWISVPPRDFGFGAQEYLAFYIAEGMKRKGHFELINVSGAYKRADDFDIIHNHLLPYGLLLADWSKTPTVHTLHHKIYRESANIFLYER